MTPTKYRPASWLLWLALLILVVGGTLTFAFYLQHSHSGGTYAINTCLTLTIVLAGVCLICATSDWWTHR